MDVLLHYFFELLGRNLPALIVLIICAWMTSAQWQRHPPSARWALFAFIWFLILDLTAIAWYAIALPIMHFEWGEARQMETIGGLVLSIAEATGYLFFVFAINAARTPYRPRRYYDDDLDISINAPSRYPDGSYTPDERTDDAPR